MSNELGIPKVNEAELNKTCLTSREVLRNVVLAGVLEPIPEKDGCTTRSTNLSKRAKLEYFLTGAVNIGWDFYDLSERIRENNYHQPEVIFDTAVKAQSNSFKNRNGSRINFGIIGCLVPVVASQLIYQGDGIKSLTKTPEVLKATGKEDVRQNFEFYKMVENWSASGWKSEFLDSATVFDYFRDIKKQTATQEVYHREYTQGFPLTQKAYQIMKEQVDKVGLLEASVVAYDQILEGCLNRPTVAADYIAVAIYLILSDFKNQTLIA